MIDGEKVTSSDMLVRRIQEHEVGDKVKLTIVRNDQMQEIEVTLQDSNEVNK
ncbi:MAG: PDZ domain-containing protein [Anaerovoracaceae bacterium]